MAKKEEVKKGVGDLESTARGSAARFNEGKVPYHLLDIRILSDSFEVDSVYKQVLDCLARWQHGGNSDSLIEASKILSVYLKCDSNGVEKAPGSLSFGGIAWDDCAHVFEYGAKKYCSWNWVKGQAWSIPFACCLRHLLKIYQGELIDPESGQTHLGHFLCNVMMLVYYERAYPEGDDRPPFLSNQE